MIRRIIHIDQDACNGCGACAAACHEGAIGMVNGKATLLRDDYCDGLGDCLPACPVNAITFVNREAAPYDEKAVQANMAQKKQNVANAAQTAQPCCPGAKARQLSSAPQPSHTGCPSAKAKHIASVSREESVRDNTSAPDITPSCLGQWPVQIKLAPVNAPYFENASLLIAADCTAYAYAGFHQTFMKGNVTLIGCPKLDATDYSEKLTEILRCSSIRQITVVRMEVPCCQGIVRAVKTALENCSLEIPLKIVTVSIDGRLLSESY